MKDLGREEISKYSSRHPLAGDPVPGHGGCYIVDIPSRNGKKSKVTVVASCSAELGWDHVSISKTHRCPNWEEMCFIKDMFFRRTRNRYAIARKPRKSYQQSSLLPASLATP